MTAAELEMIYEQKNIREIVRRNKEVMAILEDTSKDMAARIKAYHLRHPKGGASFYAFNRQVERNIDAALLSMSEEIETAIRNGIKTDWELANLKNNAFVKNYTGGTKVSGEIMQSMNLLNLDALSSFLDRKDHGMKLSDKVWKLTTDYKNQIEQYLASGITEGQSTFQIAKKLDGYIQGKPIKYKGKLLPKRNISYQAIRLAATETNMAYRMSDYHRRQKLPFVTGIEVMLSNSHPEFDICFTNWNYKLLTVNGLKTLNNIKVGDLVLTHRGRYRAIKRIYKSTVYSVDKTEIKYSYSYDSRGKTNTISATDNHPFLVNGQWLPISKIRNGDKLSLLAGRCKWCNKLIPHDREYCSKSCASKETTKTQWSNDSHRESVSKKAKMRCSNGIPYLKKWIESGKNVDNLLNPEVRARAKITCIKRSAERVKNGTHPFQQPKNRSKAAIALGKNHNKSSIEQKIESLLKEKKIKYVHSYKFIRDKVGNNGKKAFYLIDFVIPEHNIVIECDGEYWHRNKEADRLRQEEMEQGGFTFLRFTGKQICNDIEFCSQSIDRLLKNHRNEYEFMEIEIESVRHYTQKQITPITKYNFEVDEDNSYVINGIIVHNCDSMAGRYPKGFIFTGWHPVCICNTKSIMAPKKDFIDYMKTGTMDGRRYVRSIPQSAQRYVERHKAQIAKWKSRPYFLQDNFTQDFQLRKDVLKTGETVQ